jgi:hypothetical protein
MGNGLAVVSDVYWWVHGWRGVSWGDAMISVLRAEVGAGLNLNLNLNPGFTSGQ